MKKPSVGHVRILAFKTPPLLTKKPCEKGEGALYKGSTVCSTYSTTLE